MANVYTSLATSGTTIAELSTALQTKYTTGVTIHFQDTANVIFSCPQINAKVMRIYRHSGGSLYAYYGDSWTSDTTLVNSTPFFGYTTTVSVSAYHLVCGDAFVLLNPVLDSEYTNGIILFAKLTNGNSLAVGSKSDNNYLYGLAYAKDLTLGEEISLVGIDNAFTSDTGFLYKRPIHINRRNVGLEKNGDGSIATIPDLYSVSHSAGIRGAYKTDSYFIGPSSLYYLIGNTAYLHLRSSLMAEL